MQQDLFAAANTRRGFYSLFDETIEACAGKIFLIKGGPGTGKSTFMKAVADAADRKGYAVERIHCSSDTASLDGVSIPQKGMLILDATAPHCVDPKLPGIREHLLAFGEFWDADLLAPHAQEIEALSRSISDHFTLVYRYLAAAGEIRQAAETVLRRAFDAEKAERTAARLLRRLAVLPEGKPGKRTKKIVSALTKDGVLQYDETLRAAHTVVVEDSYDGAALFMDVVDRALSRLGADRVVFADPLDPDRIDHILLPGRGIAFVSKNYRLPTKADGAEKTIRLRSFLDPAILAAHKNKLAFSKKTCLALYDGIFSLLAREKELHDKLETRYIEAMDFDRLTAFTKDFIQKEI